MESERMYPAINKTLVDKRTALAPNTMVAWREFSKSVFAAGALDAKTKQLIAIAVAHATQCPYCIRSHSAQALRRGATEQEIMEAIWVASEMSAGAAYAHSIIALDELEKQKK